MLPMLLSLAAESRKFQCNGDATPGAQQPTAIGQRRTWEKEAPGNEPIANALLVSLLHEGLVPEGGVLDVGAFDGHFARFYANLMPDRKIFAIDPAMHNVNKMRKQMKAVPNLCTLWGAVGVRDEPAQVSVSLDELSLKDQGYHYANERGRRFPIHALDTIFDEEQRMGFLHLDVEGHELAALKGATRLLQRDAPLISYELAVHSNQTYSTELLSFVESLGYTSFLVEEIAGMNADVRNLLAFPSSRLTDFQSSPALNTAYMGNTLLPVSSRTILLHAFPCCKKGGDCCPVGARGSCCSHWRVSAWITSVVQHGGADLQWFTRRRWYDQNFRPQLRSPREQGNHLRLLRRALNNTGLSNEHDHS